MRFLVLVAALAVCHPTGASGFGADGHEAVCEIAYRELPPGAKERVNFLIALETDDRIRTFRESCVWPDFRVPAQRARRPEHYINVPRSWIVIGDPDCHETDRCLFTAIAHDVAVLSARETSDGQKLAALKFLGHWVGDIHPFGKLLHARIAPDRRQAWLASPAPLDWANESLSIARRAEGLLDEAFSGPPGTDVRRVRPGIGAQA